MDSDGSNYVTFILEIWIDTDYSCYNLNFFNKKLILTFFFYLRGIPVHAASVQIVPRMHHGRVTYQYVALRTARFNLK